MEANESNGLSELMAPCLRVDCTKNARSGFDGHCTTCFYVLHESDPRTKRREVHEGKDVYTYTRALFEAATLRLGAGTRWLFEVMVCNASEGNKSRRADMLAVHEGHLIMVEWDRGQHRDNTLHGESCRQLQIEDCTQRQYKSVASIRVNTSSYCDEMNVLHLPPLDERIAVLVDALAEWRESLGSGTTARSGTTLDFFFYNRRPWQEGSIEILWPLVQTWPSNGLDARWSGKILGETISRNFRKSRGKSRGKGSQKSRVKDRTCSGGSGGSDEATGRTDMIIAAATESAATTIADALSRAATVAVYAVSGEGTISQLRLQPAGAAWGTVDVLILVATATGSFQVGHVVKDQAFRVARAIADEDAKHLRWSPLEQRRWQVGIGVLPNVARAWPKSTFLVALATARLLCTQQTISCYASGALECSMQRKALNKMILNCIPRMLCRTRRGRNQLKHGMVIPKSEHSSLHPKMRGIYCLYEEADEDWEPIDERFAPGQDQTGLSYISV